MEKSKTQLKTLARKGGKEAVKTIKAVKEESARLRAMKRLPPRDKAVFEDDGSSAIVSEAKWAKRFLPPKPPKPPKEGKEGKGGEGKGKPGTGPAPAPEETPGAPPAAE